MTPHLHGMGEKGHEKRRSHKKSRRGCRNCKLRRVKCDETLPKCNKCISFKVSCNYDPKALDLQISFDGRDSSAMNLQQTLSLIDTTESGVVENPAYLYPGIGPDIFSAFRLDRESWERLGRFQTRTVLTIGPIKTAQLYQKETIALACAHPYLMHVVQTITAIHDRYLSESPTSRHTITEVYHWSQAAALFNQKLSAPVQSFDCDALWVTAVLLCSTIFSSVDASSPEEAWPLKPSEPSDLEWMRMICGKMVIWNLTNPSRPDGLFNALAVNHECWGPSSTDELEGISPAFVQLYGLENPSTAYNNPYHTAVHALAPLLHIECNQTTVPKFVQFICDLQPNFKDLLEQKDPRALLLMAYWYAKMCQSIWWAVRRARLECQAICLYLERYYLYETAIQEMLYFPKMRCGLAA